MTFFVFADCESCTRPTSTNSGYLEASEHGLTRETWFLARRLKVVAVAGLMWVLWCFIGGARFCLVFQVTIFSSSYIQSSQRRLGEGAPTASQSAHRELAPTNPHQVYRLVCSDVRNTTSMASSVDQNIFAQYDPSLSDPPRPFQHQFPSFVSAIPSCSRD